MTTSKHSQWQFLIRSLFVCLVWAFSSAGLAQDSDDETRVESSAEESKTPENDSENSRQIEEIRVTAAQSFFLLNSQIEYATARLYSVYNDLNEIEEYDVDCRNSDWTGTHIKQQECWPAFFDDIVARNTQDARFGIAELMPVQQLKRLHAARFDELRANIEKVASENPPAAEALLELGKLERALAAKKERCKEQPAFLFVFRLCP